jgi:diguanylate cyclase (GGDEF)-like protein
MSDLVIANQPTEAMRFVTTGYSRLLLAVFSLSPAFLIGYLFYFQNPALKFENHAFHEIAIVAATLEGLFVTYVTWLCYRSSRESLLRWMTLAFLGFVLIYAPHGAFTRLANHNMWLFLLYGPASRLSMAILLFVALLSYHRVPDAAHRRSAWLGWVGLFLVIDVAVAIIAHSPLASAPAVRLSMEGGALVFSTLNVMVLLMGRIRSALMVIFAISITFFALSSVAFILARPWNHMWWLAHAIFAAGFFLLSYGVVKAFLTTHSFSTIYSQEELMARLAESVTRTERALEELKHSNQRLERLAATDPLTGANNRRRFTEHVEVEISRFKRSGVPFSVVAFDLDNFKVINDRYGHHVGDDVLKEFVQKCRDAIRPYDNVARVGGEEFMVLLPETLLEAGHDVAERVRVAVESASFASGPERLTAVTVSSGVSQWGRDGETIEAILRVADRRLYRAKDEGRNRVIAA